MEKHASNPMVTGKRRYDVASSSPTVSFLMSDPYHILGVARTATASEIKSAYRKLAKKLHPDVNPGRKDIEQKFKEVTAAYDLLSDEAKRARFDRGEIDAQGQERGFGGGGFGGVFGCSGHHQGGSGGE